MPRAVISGTGAYVPTRVLTNKELESVIDTTADWILSRTGISERRIALPDEATSDLSYPAAKQALENAGLLATDIDATSH
ncbi:MAG: 3-oxoacyl-(acyl-carrier-protein) synthase 3 protein 1 [Firmicutes bacterium]|nr:3-oxoacyl-(acyl-carrier-protein) synthase 3 protein 1 [candidate division NPL-UPA2 bacterium]